MEKYADLYKALALPDVAYKLATEALAFPDPIAQFPFYSNGYPPAFVPLWCLGVTQYEGIWKHWFCGRQISVVRMNMEGGIEVREIARSFGQFIMKISLSGLCEGFVNEEQLMTFCKNAGLTEGDSERIVRIADEVGDDLRALRDDPRFVDDPPLSCFECSWEEADNILEYPGDFPTEAMDLDRSDLREYCSFEMSIELAQRIAQRDDAPPWFGATEEGQQRKVFDQLLQKGDLAGAWMSLNSRQWHPNEATEAIRALESEAGDETFSLMVEAWIPNNPYGLY